MIANPQVTHDKIAELYACGVNCGEIAIRLNCSVRTIFFKMREARRANPEVARREMQQRTCKCGRPKRPSYAECSGCRNGRLCPPKKDWNSGDAVQQALQLAEGKSVAAEQADAEANVKCKCERREKSATAQACVICEGTGERLDQLMAASRGISVEKLRRQLRCQKYGQKRQGVAA